MTESNATPLTLLTRVACGLCDELQADLTRLGVAYKLVDIDQDEALRQRYDQTIPVLLRAGREIARAPFTPQKLRALAQAGVLSR